MRKNFSVKQIMSFAMKDGDFCMSLNYIKIIVDRIVAFSKNVRREHPVRSKATLALGFAICIYIMNILILIYVLKGIEILNNNFDLAKLLGMLAIIVIPIITTVKMVVHFKEKIIEYEDYFRWLSNIITVLIPIVLLYGAYYPEEDIIKILLLNKYLLGAPFVILLICPIIGLYKLKDKETN